VQADTRDNFYIVVTHDVPALRHFREWIERGSTAAVQQGSESFDPSQTQRMARESIERGVSAGDDLTRAFGTSPLPKETKAEPDDFTRMFAPPGSPNEPKAPAAPPAPAQQAGPGEFTRMFSAPRPAAPPPALPNEPKAPAAHPSPAQPGPGEFTRMFSAPSSAPPPVLPNEPKAPAAPPAPAQQGAGEFTRMF